MFTVSIDPIIFSFGHFVLRWYGLIVVAAIGTGIWLAGREAERKGLKKEDIYDLVLWILPSGLLGARLLHVLDHWSHFATDPVRIFYIWEGGLAIWGGVLGGLLAGGLFARRRGWSFLSLLDTLAPGLVLGQAIGRAACVITGDAVGRPTTGPFGLAYTNPGAMVPELGVYYTPTPVYELLMNLAIFAVVWNLRRKPLPDGMLFVLYLLLYAGGRFVVTFWSAYQVVVLGLNQAQLISLAALIIGLPALVFLWHKQAVRA